MPIAALFSIIQLVPPVNTEILHPVQQALNLNIFSFVAYAISEPGAPSAVCRSHRRRTLLVRLRPLDSLHEIPNFSFHDSARKNVLHPLQNAFPAEAKPGTTEWDSVLKSKGNQDQRTPTYSGARPGKKGMLDAGGGGGSSARNTETVLNRALHSLTGHRSKSMTTGRDGYNYTF